MNDQEYIVKNKNVDNLKKMFENSKNLSINQIDIYKAEIKQTLPPTLELDSYKLSQFDITDNSSLYTVNNYYSIERSKVIEYPKNNSPVINSNYLKNEPTMPTIELMRDNTQEYFDAYNFSNPPITIEPSPIRTLSKNSIKSMNSTNSASATWLNEAVPVVESLSPDVQNNYENLSILNSVEPELPHYANINKEMSKQKSSQINNDSVKKLNEFFGENKDTVTDLEKQVFSKIFKNGTVEDKISSENQEVISKSKKNEALASNSKKDLSSWHNKVLKTLKKHMYGLNSQKLETGGGVKRSTFGVPLESCPLSSSQNVPLLVEFCVNVVDTIGLHIQGIYRIPGNSASVNEVVNELSKDADSINYESERWLDAHVVGSLLKLFFRKLPDALFTDKCYDAFINCIKRSDWDRKMSEMKYLIKNLPSINYLTLRFLIYHLKRVSANQHYNKMDIHNLAIMFGPSLVHPKDETTAHMLTDMNEQTHVVAHIIKYCDWLFNDLPENQNIPRQENDLTFHSSSSNLQLLANAESIIALKMKDSSPSSPPDTTGPFGFFKQGLMRRSNRRKRHKSDANSDEEGSEVVSRDFSHLVINTANAPANNLHNFKTDSVPFNEDLKRANALHMSASCDNLNKNIRKSKLVYETEETETPAERQSLVKCYPAYNFHDTTIGSNRKPRKKSNTSLCDFAMPANASLSSNTARYLP